MAGPLREPEDRAHIGRMGTARWLRTVHALFMRPCYPRCMGSTILQVRDVPEDVLARLRERAATRGISLSAYVRELLAEEARQETMDEVIKRIATRAPVEVSDEEILAAIQEGRQ